MRNSKQYYNIWLILTLLLSGCVANNEMSQVVEQLSQSNKQAQLVMAKLSDKDQAMTLLVNDRNSQIEQLAIAQVQRDYFKSLAKLRAMIITANIDIILSHENAKQRCLTIIDGEEKSLIEQVNSAELQASNLLTESKKFPNDKVLELQAAKAAADYFGRLNNTNSISVNAKASCVEQLQVASSDAVQKIKKFQDSQEAALKQLKKSKTAEHTLIRVFVLESSQKQFEALLAWSHENEIAYNNIMMHSKTNNILSKDGVLASAFKGFGQGAIATLVGRDVAIPSTAEIRTSGKELIDGLSQESEEAFSNVLANAKQSLTTIKNNVLINAGQLVQNSVMSVLRDKAEN